MSATIGSDSICTYMGKFISAIPIAAHVYVHTYYEMYMYTTLSRDIFRVSHNGIFSKDSIFMVSVDTSENYMHNCSMHNGYDC